VIASARAAREAELLARVAAGTWPGATLTGAAPLAGDASARRYVRLALEGGGAPATAMAMMLPDGPRGASEEIAAEVDVGELPFLNVQRFLARHGVAVPEVYAFADEAGVLLLEDVGDLPLADAAQQGGSRGRALLEDASATLAHLASLAREPDPSCVAFRATYDRALIGRELEVVATHGLVADDATAPRAAGSDPEIAAALARLGDAIAAQPLVLMHRDYHAWNLHVDPHGRLRVIDFQDALLGPALYDLASLCTDRDSDRFVDPDTERVLLRRWAAELERRGVLAYRDDDLLRADYLRAVAYRTLRVIGRFRFLALEKDKPAYLRFLPRMARQTRRALAALGDDDRDARALLRELAARSAHFA
jgi:aminoglycoside/choline kinase family phosphotransferase